MNYLYSIADNLRQILLRDGLELHFNPMNVDKQRYALYRISDNVTDEYPIFCSPHSPDYYATIISSSLGRSLKFFREDLLNVYGDTHMYKTDYYVISEPYFKAIADEVFCFDETFNSIIVNSENYNYSIEHDTEKEQFKHIISVSSYSKKRLAIDYYFLLDDNRKLQSIRFSNYRYNCISKELDLENQKKFLCFLLSMITIKQVYDYIDIDINKHFEYCPSYYDLMEQLLV